MKAPLASSRHTTHSLRLFRPIAPPRALHTVTCAAYAAGPAPHRGAQASVAPSRLGGARLPARAPPPQRRSMAVRAQKRITQSDFTEKAWQAIIAAPQVRPASQRAHPPVAPRTLSNLPHHAAPRPAPCTLRRVRSYARGYA